MMDGRALVCLEQHCLWALGLCRVQRLHGGHLGLRVFHRSDKAGGHCFIIPSWPGPGVLVKESFKGEILDALGY